MGERRAAAAGEPRSVPRGCSDQGWTDALRALHPDEPIYTFWDYLRNRWARDAGLRIDHLLLSAALAAGWSTPASTGRCEGSEGASDHAPAWITLR